MKKDNQYHWTQIEASPSQYNWQQPYEQKQLFISDPAQDEIATLKAQLRQLETENAILQAEKRHWQIANEVTGNWHGGYGVMIGHAVREDGIYIQSMVSGQTVTVFVDKDTALDCGWMDRKEAE